jgi:dynein heavy chain
MYFQAWIYLCFAQIRQVTDFHHKNFRSQLENCQSSGSPLLVHDVSDDLDVSSVMSVLDKNVTKRRTSSRMRRGDWKTDVSHGFVLYMTTKLPLREFSPELASKLLVVDFTMTTKGLENHLLYQTIAKIKPVCIVHVNSACGPTKFPAGFLTRYNEMSW